MTHENKDAERLSELIARLSSPEAIAEHLSPEMTRLIIAVLELYPPAKEVGLIDHLLKIGALQHIAYTLSEGIGEVLTHGVPERVEP